MDVMVVFPPGGAVHAGAEPYRRVVLGQRFERALDAIGSSPSPRVMADGDGGTSLSAASRHDHRGDRFARAL